MSQYPAMSKRLHLLPFVVLMALIFLTLFIVTTFVWAISITLPFLIGVAILRRILTLQVFIQECDGVDICLHVVVRVFGHAIMTRHAKNIIFIRRCIVVPNVSNMPLTWYNNLFGKCSDGREVFLLGGGLSFLFNLKDEDIAKLMDECKQKGVNIVSSVVVQRK